MKRTTVFIIFILIFSILLFTSCSKKKVERELPEQEKSEEPVTEKETDTTQKELETVAEASEEEVITDKTVKEEHEGIQPETTVKGEKVFELQLVAVRVYSRIEIEQEKLARYGFDTFITTTIKDGETFYRLRLDDIYTYLEAKELGEKLKKQFSSIHEYWIQKVK